MALSTEQLALINNLTYTADIKPIPSIYDYEGMTVQEYINDYMAITSNVDPGKEYSTFTDGQEWGQILNAISNDPDLCNMTISATYNDKTMSDRGIVFTDPHAGEAVVAYRGTGAKEWPDNFHGGGPTGAPDGVSTPQQEKALNWYQEQYKNLDLGKYETVTVTGHSKGGNKAQYIAIEDDTVDRCVSFDGQGFSDDYVLKKQDLIKANGGKIINHSAEGDYVNILLNAVGEQKYYKPNQSSVKTGGLIENHCPNTYLHYDENGNVVMYEGKQMKEMQDVDKFLNSYLRTLSPEKRAETLQVVGELVQKGMEGEFNGLSVSDIINNYLNNDRYKEILVPLVAYLIRYQEEYPETAESIKTILNGMGMGEWNDTIDQIVNYATNGFIRGLFKADHDILDNWITKQLLSGMFKDMGVTSDEEKNILLGLMYQIIVSHDEIDKIPDGKDKRVRPNSSSGNGNHDFMVYIHGLNSAEVQIESEDGRMAGLIGRVERIRSQLDGSLVIMKPVLSGRCEDLKKKRDGMKSMRNALHQISREYTSAESRITSF